MLQCVTGAKSFAYRSGGVSMALMYTNIPSLSENRFILEPKTMISRNEEPAEVRLTTADRRRVSQLNPDMLTDYNAEEAT